MDVPSCTESLKYDPENWVIGLLHYKLTEVESVVTSKPG